MQEIGKVIRVADGRAGVQIRREAGAHCGGCTVCRAFGDQGLVLWVDATDLAVGDGVTVEIPEVGPWRAIVTVFALPLAAAIVGLIVGSQWTGLQRALGMTDDSAGLGLAVGLGAAAFVLACLEDRRFRRRHPPRILEVRHPA